jgi:TetR/AcrR family transcriptional regulator, cholesterol catabolism regulator
MVLIVPQQRDSEAKFGHILKLSAEIFAEKGFAGTSVRDISRATGISLSGLYYYFESKQELLYLIQNETFTFVLNRLKARLANVTGAEQRLRTLIHNHVEYFLSHRNEMKVLTHEEDALEEPFRKEVAAIKRRYYALARAIFEELAAEGFTRERNPRFAVLSLFGMMNWIYKWHNSGVDPTAEELSAGIANIFLRGVLFPWAEENSMADGIPAVAGTR